MTTIQAQIVGETALLPRDDVDRLVELAQRSEAIDLQVQRESDVPTTDMMRLAEQGGAFGFWARSRGGGLLRR